MMYSTKTALVIRADLPPWQVANVAAFLSGGLAGTYPEIVGEPYRDGDGRLYTPMIREPIFVYGATSVELTRTHGRAVNRGMRFAIYTEPRSRPPTTPTTAQASPRPQPPSSTSSGSASTTTANHRQDHRRTEIHDLTRGGGRHHLRTAR
jgi:hypothetical protein